MTASCILLFAAFGVVSGKDLPIEVIGPERRPLPMLCDSKTETGVTVSAGSYTIRPHPGEAIIALSFHVQTQNKGKVTVRCDDVMPRSLALEAGTRWYSLRLPNSVAGKISVTWEAAGASWNETRVLTRMPVTSRPENATPEVVRGAVTVPSEAGRPACDIAPGFMCNWFDRGLTDGMTRAGTRDELIARLKEFGAGSIRYPGGSWTYGYPPYEEAVPVFVKAGMDTYSYGLRELNRFGWASAEQYFRFCRDAGLTAWYEINPGFWYDRKTRQVRKTLAMDKAKDPFKGDEIAAAMAETVELAKLAKGIGVPVIWEIGNEDYCYFTAPTYARLVGAFVEGLRRFDPKVRVAVCGDSYSWSDWSFADALVSELGRVGVKRIDYSSQHLYLEGIWEPVGNTYRARRWSTPQELSDSTASCWWNIRPLFVARPERFRSSGLGETRMAMTEFNVVCNAPAGDIEHSVGRALGEAEAVCGILQDVAALFFHDLVRTHPDETFYARLDYYPDNPAGRKYHWFPEGAAAGIVIPHAGGRILWREGGLCISYSSKGLYATCVNRSGVWRRVQVDMRGRSIDATQPAECRQFRAAAAECSYFDYHLNRSQIAPSPRMPMEFDSPPFSVVGIRIGLR